MEVLHLIYNMNGMNLRSAGNFASQRLLRDYSRFSRSRAGRNPNTPLSDSESLLLDSYDWVVHHTYSTEGVEACKGLLCDLADLLGVHVGTVFQHFESLLANVANEERRKRCREDETIQPVIKRRDGNVQISIDLGHILESEKGRMVLDTTQEMLLAAQSGDMRVPLILPVSPHLEEAPLRAAESLERPSAAPQLTNASSNLSPVQMPRKVQCIRSQAPTERPAAAKEHLAVNRPEAVQQTPSLPVEPKFKSAIVTGSSGQITIHYQNSVDDSVLPTDWDYLHSSVESPIVTAQLSESRVMCRCANIALCRDMRLCSCAQFSARKNGGELVAYVGAEKLVKAQGRKLRLCECSASCACNKEKCGLSFLNHESPTLHQFYVARHSESNGNVWKLMTRDGIKKDSFAAEMTGEIIVEDDLSEESFEVFLGGEKNKLYMDISIAGNLTRFIRHSCDPSLKVVRVSQGMRDERLARVALFAARDIQPGEELSVNFQDLASQPRLVCTCGAANCKGYIH